jgi:transcriptional regulator with XRE-family HTH domain
MVTTLSGDTVSRLTRARKLGGLSGRQLSQLAGVADGFASMIERGVSRAPSFGVMDAFALVLGVSLDWLAHGIGPEPTAEQIKAAVEAARAARAHEPPTATVAA